MKTYKGLWEQLITEENFRKAMQRSQIRKRGQRQVRKFNENAEKNLEAIRQSVIRGEFHTSEYRQRKIYEPKERIIYKLPYAPDRIVQHAIMNVLEPILVKKMIRHSYACIKDRGPLEATKQCSAYVRRWRFCLKCDIRKFYPSIDQEILSGMFRRFIRDEKFLALVDDVIFSYPGGKNCPIGNYMSQWCGNFYLTAMDNYILHQLKPGGYIRYCDDFLLFDDDKKKLHECRQKLGEWLRETLKLEFSKAEVFDVKQGVDFCGYRMFGKYVLIRKSTALRLKRRYGRMWSAVKSGKYDLKKIAGQASAANGLMKHACSHNLRKAIRHDEMWEFIGEKLKEEEQQYENAGTGGRDGAAGGRRQQRAADPDRGGELRSGGHAEGVLHPGEHDDDPAGGAGIPRSDPGEH